MNLEKSLKKKNRVSSNIDPATALVLLNRENCITVVYFILELFNLDKRTAFSYFKSLRMALKIPFYFYF